MQETATKHTPGPWSVHDGGRAETGWGGQGPSVCAEHTDGTCEPLVEFCGGKGHVMANARLIAAAPELLEAAEAVAAMLDGHGNNEDEQDAVRVLRAAIAKATGE